MKKLTCLIIGGILFIFASTNLHAQENPVAFTGAHIIPVVGDEIENGVLVVHRGEIVTVGDANTRIPRRAERINVSGKVIMPGLVDPHSHLGEGDGGDRSATTHPEVRIMDSIDPRSTTFIRALAGGLTSINVMPGSGHLMSGQTVYLKLRKANMIEDMLLVVDEENNIFGGLKMANGTNPLRNPPFSGTRAKSASMIRELFIKAQNYMDKVEAADGDESKMPARDIGMEALVEVLEGKRLVHHHTHRHDDILTAIRLSEEFGYRVVLQHVSEAYKVADEIVAAGVPASLIALDSNGGKLEAMDFSNTSGKVLEDAGAWFGYHTDDGITDSRLFLRSAAMAMREGMSRQAALEALTINNARMLDAEHIIGSLEEGKHADFVILSGEPFSVYTKVEQTWIEGNKVWDRNNPDDLKYATGGFEIYRSGVFNHHTEEAH